MNKKNAIICCAIGAGGLTYGGMNFELGGIDSTAVAITVSMSIALGTVTLFYGVKDLIKVNTKETPKKKEKPKVQKKTKKANLMKDEQDAVLSVDLMKREKELKVRRKEVKSLYEKRMAEIEKEEKAIGKRLIEKAIAAGWVQESHSPGMEYK
mgnify:CR=1 FL=1